MKRCLLVAMLAGCAGTPAPAPPASGPTVPEPTVIEGMTIVERQTTPDGITEARLDNGLRILLQEKRDVPVVSSYIWYRVGSANEERGATGLAHYLEHLLFKGTDRYQKGEIDALTLQNGGANNAFTWRDYTAYYFNFASDRWDTALQIESNRMRNTVFDAKEFASEKKVVLEELYRALDRPTGKLEREMRVKLWGAAHPYGHHTLGTEEDLTERVDVETVKGFYDKYYWPNNATIVIVGDFESDAVLRRIEALFGDIPAGQTPPALSHARPPEPGNARIELEDDVSVARAIIDHPGVVVGEPDDFVLDVISRLLGGGVASRLHQRLVENDKLAVAASCWNGSGNLPGSFTVEVQAQTGADRAKIDTAVAEELARLAAEPVGEAELNRAKTQIIAGFTFDKEKADERAYLIGLYDAHGDHTLMGRYADEIAAVTPERIQAAAAKYLQAANRLTGWVVPSGKGGGGGEEHGAGKRAEEHFRKFPRRGAHRIGADVPNGGGPELDVKRFTLANGLQLRVVERPNAPIVAVRAYVRADRRYETAAQAGLAALHGELLRGGTTSRDALAIAETIENVGGRLSTSSAGLAMKVRAQDRSLALELAADLLRRSTFPQEQFDKKRDEQLTKIAAQNDAPRTLAYLAAREVVYGDHPLGRPALGTAATVGALTRDDVAAWYRTYVVPGNTTLAIVGDVEANAVKAEVEQLFGDWSGDTPAKPDLPDPAPQTAAHHRFITRAGDEQLNVYLMRLGITRDNPDFYKLLVMDYVLGMGPGFTDRLSKNLRDEQGLCYTVYARIAENADEEPGIFEAYIGTNPGNKQAALDGFRKHIARIREELVTDAEIDAAKAYLTGRFVFNFETREQVAGFVINSERLGLPDDYLQRYKEWVNAVTKEEVLDVAKRYLHPDHMTLAIAGRVDQNGDVLSDGEKK